MRNDALRIVALTGVVMILVGPVALGDPLSIYELQYTTNPTGESEYVDQVVDCSGGIVILKFAGFRPRVILYDPAHPDAWGGIQVKDWSTTLDLFDHVELGDWISLTNVTVEEFRGTTFLQWYTTEDPGFTIVSQGHAIPDPIGITVADIPAPVEGPPGEWHVVDHAAEPLESMFVSLDDVTIGAKDFGKAEDNYELIQGADKAWGTDYMNVDAGGPYHPLTQTGTTFARISGLLEQYTNLTDGWDYYQLQTRDSNDLRLGQPVPTVSQWGLAVLALLTLGAATIVFGRVHRAPAQSAR